MSTRWKGNFKGYPIDLFLEACSVQDLGDIPWRIGGQLQWWWLEEEDDGNDKEERMSNAYIEDSWANSEDHSHFKGLHELDIQEGGATFEDAKGEATWSTWRGISSATLTLSIFGEATNGKFEDWWMMNKWRCEDEIACTLASNQ